MKTIAARYLAGIVESCKTAGCDQQALLEDYTNGDTLFPDSKNIPATRRFPNQMLYEILAKAEVLSGKAEIGLLCGQNIRPEALSELGHALLYCENLRQVIETNIRYQALTQQLGHSLLVDKGDKSHLIWKSLSIAPESESSENNIQRLVADMVMAGHAGFGRWLTWTHNKQIVAVHFQHNKPSYVETYHQIFDCPILFGQKENAMVIMRDDLEMPLPQSNPDLLREACMRLDTALAHMQGSISYSEHVSRVLQTSLLGHGINLEWVSEKLGVNPRTLRRKLTQENTKFNTLLTKARQARCRHELKHGRSFSEIALRLGYSQQSAFNRAFKSWFGITPMQYTERQKETDKLFELFAP